MFCKNCGAQINDGSKFCPVCGGSQENAPTQQATPVQPVQPVAPAQPVQQNSPYYVPNSGAYVTPEGAVPNGNNPQPFMPGAQPVQLNVELAQKKLKKAKTVRTICLALLAVFVVIIVCLMASPKNDVIIDPVEYSDSESKSGDYVETTITVLTVGFEEYTENTTTGKKEKTNCYFCLARNENDELFILKATEGYFNNHLKELEEDVTGTVQPVKIRADVKNMDTRVDEKMREGTDSSWVFDGSVVYNEDYMLEACEGDKTEGDDGMAFSVMLIGLSFFVLIAIAVNTQKIKRLKKALGE